MSKQGLEHWLNRYQTHLPKDEDAEVPGEIPISDILCEHGVLDPSKSSHMKCINEVRDNFFLDLISWTAK